MDRLARPLVMGIVNVTPDSFSDGGRFFNPQAAVDHALRLVEQGADILDVGGESTRPGAPAVVEAVEIARVVPVIVGIRARTDKPISIDTMKPGVARAAIEAGATIWNDVAALGFAPEGPVVAAELGCEVVLMHMQGEPRTMQEAPHYEDVVEEVRTFLAERAQAAMAAGVAREKIWLDPGVGFGKTVDHNLTLIRDLDRICDLGFPVLLGVSRKRFVQALDPSATVADDRLGGSLAGALYGVARGAAAVRVHDVRETTQALKVWAALQSGESVL